MDSFFDATLATSTVGTDGADVCAFVLELEFELQEAHQQLVATRSKVDGIRNRVMPFLQAKPLHFARTRSQGHRDRAKATALQRVAEPAKTLREESAALLRLQRAIHR